MVNTANVVYLLLYISGIYGLVVWPVVSRVTTFLFQPLDVGLTVAAKCVIAFLAADFAAYWTHRAAHRVPLLWRFHRVHHSDQELGPLTTFRFHFIEITWRMTVVAIPLRLLGVSSWSMPMLFVFAPLVIEILAHSDLGWSYGMLGRLLVSPAHHGRHHQAASNGNFAMLLSVWDAIFRTERA